MEDELGTTTKEDELILPSLTEDELPTEATTEDELSPQLDTISAVPAITSSMQVETDICEQAPAINWQKTWLSCWLAELLGLSSFCLPSSGISTEQAVNAKTTKIAVNEKKWLIFIRALHY
jgi:hypothetical protein